MYLPYIRTAHPLLFSTHSTTHNHLHPHPTLQPTQTFTATLLLSKFTSNDIQIPHSQACTNQCINRRAVHHSAMHLWSTYHPYIFPTTHATICTTPPYIRTAHPLLSSVHSTTHNHHHPHPTLQPTQTFIATLLLSKFTSNDTYKSQIYKHKPRCSLLTKHTTSQKVPAQHTLQQALYTHFISTHNKPHSHQHNKPQPHFPTN